MKLFTNLHLIEVIAEGGKESRKTKSSWPILEEVEKTQSEALPVCARELILSVAFVLIEMIRGQNQAYPKLVPPTQKMSSF